MSPTSRAIFQTVLTSDISLSDAERGAVQRLVNGVLDSAPKIGRVGDEPLLVTQKAAARLLSVDRVTVWRMTRGGLLHPVEILPGTWRYLWSELEEFARNGWRREPQAEDTKTAA